MPNRCRSAATACLHGLAEAAVLAAGYAPAIGFLHTGKPLSFVYDIADLWKTSTVIPEAFRVAAEAQKGTLDMPVERAVRLACRDRFRSTGLLAKIVPPDRRGAEGRSAPNAATPSRGARPSLRGRNRRLR